LKQVLSYLESTNVGSALLDFLQKHTRQGKSSQSLTLFREYLMKLATVTEDIVEKRNRLVEPILVNAEAIAHGETLTIPLHFTNHNPVPVKIFLDVAEVEGMRISISRETSRLRGDGNSIIDYLPPSIGRRFDKLDTVGWATHSREGLRNFLIFNEYASQIFQSLPHRDVIDLSIRATRRSPL